MNMHIRDLVQNGVAPEASAVGNNWNWLPELCPHRRYVCVGHDAQSVAHARFLTATRVSTGLREQPDLGPAGASRSSAAPPGALRFRRDRRRRGPPTGRSRRLCARARIAARRLPVAAEEAPVSRSSRPSRAPCRPPWRLRVGAASASGPAPPMFAAWPNSRRLSRRRRRLRRHCVVTIRCRNQRRRRRRIAEISDRFCTARASASCATASSASARLPSRSYAMPP